MGKQKPRIRTKLVPKMNSERSATKTSLAERLDKLEEAFNSRLDELEGNHVDLENRICDLDDAETRLDELEDCLANMEKESDEVKPDNNKATIAEIVKLLERL